MILRQILKRIAEEGVRDTSEKFLVPLLALASYGYGLAVSGRAMAYRLNWLKRKRLSIPVVSVGNLTWGGTGKTPFVKCLANKLDAWDEKVLILTRGYSQDEVRELEQACPKALLGVGKNRYEAALEKLTRLSPGIAVLDDGFQHIGLARDLEIVLINGAQPFGTGHLIPWGSLREPVSQLSRSDVIVLTHADRASIDRKSEIQRVVKRYAPKASLIEAVHVPDKLYRAKNHEELDLAYLRGKDVASLSGIGFPDSFRWMIESLGGRIIRSFEVLDHHAYMSEELEAIRALKTSELAQEIVITEKDYLREREKITKILEPLVLAVKLKIISGEDDLDDRLHRLLAL